MAKTEIQIERDFFAIIQNSSLKKAIKGNLYRRGQRPDNANSEDCVVKFLGGIDEQVQSGTVLLNIYVPYIAYSDGRRGENLSRIGELQEAANSIIEEYDGDDYLIKKEITPQSYQMDEIEQSVIAFRIRFQRLNQE